MKLANLVDPTGKLKGKLLELIRRVPYRQSHLENIRIVSYYPLKDEIMISSFLGYEGTTQQLYICLVDPQGIEVYPIGCIEPCKSSMAIILKDNESHVIFHFTNEEGDILMSPVFVLKGTEDCISLIEVDDDPEQLYTEFVSGDSNGVVVNEIHKVLR